MSNVQSHLLSVLAAILVFVGDTAFAQSNNAYSRGEYLARIMDCGGCHTPGALAGKPDQTRALSGSRIGFHIPELGYFYPPNLTSDRETGLGSWSESDIIRAVRTGVRADGRMLAPVMPWHAYAALSDSDAKALARYLKSLPPIRHAVPPLTGANAPAPAPYLAVIAPKHSGE
jgi:mono/diheme cytochrome c family protein